MTGNQEISNYTSLSTYSVSGLAIFDGVTYNGSTPSRVPNPDLKWESTEQFNVGLDVGILDGRFRANFDFFTKYTRDMLLDLPLPLSSGYNSMLINVGKMKNTGIESMLNWYNITSGDFDWNTTIVFSAIKNEVLELGELSSITKSFSIILPGYPLESYYGYEITGIFQTPEEVASSAQPNSRPGFPIFKDANNDEKIDTDDRVILGNPWPDFTFSVRNTFNYKNFGLDVFFQGQYGNELYNQNAQESMYPGNFRRNRMANQILDRWTPENPDAKWPSATEPTEYGAIFNNMLVEDATYIRLKALNISYIIPTTKLNFISRAKIYLTGENLFTLTNYTGYDPEANAHGQSNTRIDQNSYPLART